MQKRKSMYMISKTGKEVSLPDFADGSIQSVGISRSENLMLLTVGSSTSPNNKYLYNFTTKELSTRSPIH